MFIIKGFRVIRNPFFFPVPLTLIHFVQAPFNPTTTGYEEENEAIEKGQLPFVDCRKKLWPDL